MRKCPNCGRENDDSFVFCLDCGQRLVPEAAGAQQQAAPTQPPPATSPPSAAAQPAAAPPAPSLAQQPAAPPGSAVAAATPASQAAQPAAGAEPSLSCPACGKPVKAGDAFCAHCGHRMGDSGPRSTMFLHSAGPEAAAQSRARLILINPDGTEGAVYNLAEGKTIIGRSQGTIQFADDPYLSPQHAELDYSQGKLTVSDKGSLNGVYIKLGSPAPVAPGATFRIGRQLLRLELPGELTPLDIKAPDGDDSRFWGSPPPTVWARLVQVLEGGKIGEIHLLVLPEVIIGREEGNIRFPEDGFISSRHCALTNQQGDCQLRDLGSSNGTYLRIAGPQQLQNGDRLQVGSQVVKVDLT